MKAIQYTEYGGPEVLQLCEIDRPIPQGNEILVKVHASSVNFGDLIARNFKAITPRKFHMPFLFWLIGKAYFGFSKPKIRVLGSEFSGNVESVGPDVQRFKPGDSVFGYLGPRMGAYAEYLRMSEDGVVAPKPANMTHEEAASVPYGAIMAWNLLKKIELGAGHKVLVNGASGGIGPLLVQLASAHFGAVVTGVCSTPRVEYVRALGANTVIDYTKEDFTEGTETYDFIIDILGKCSFARCKAVLKRNGRCLYISFKMKQLLQMLLTSMIGDKKAVCVSVSEKAEDLAAVKELIETGKLKSIIDRTFPLEQASEAHRYVESGSKTGNVVIRVAHADTPTADPSARPA